MNGYIYIITNLQNQMQYIGQTIRTIEQRFSGHKTSALNKLDETYLHRAMRKYGIENFIVQEVCRVEKDSQLDLFNELNQLEKHYIAEFNTLIPNGYNMTKGGAEAAEWIKRKVDEYDVYGNFIQTHDSIIAASRYMNSSNNSAIHKCCTGQSKFAFQRIWRYHEDLLEQYDFPDITVAQRVYKKASVDQYTLTGEFIQTYSSIAEANIQLHKPSTDSHIAECCKGKMYTAHGYIWRYQGDSFDLYPTQEKRCVKCAKYDLEGNLIAIYNSIKEACISLDKDIKSSSHITSCCKGRRKTAFGYQWKYV